MRPQRKLWLIVLLLGVVSVASCYRVLPMEIVPAASHQAHLPQPQASKAAAPEAAQHAGCDLMGATPVASVERPSTRTLPRANVRIAYAPLIPRAIWAERGPPAAGC